MSDPWTVAFGRRVKTLREARRLTQEQPGQAAGLGAKFIGLTERGQKQPSFAAVERLADALDVECYELFIPVNRRGKGVEEEINALLDDENRTEPARVADFLRLLRAAVRR